MKLCVSPAQCSEFEPGSGPDRSDLKALMHSTANALKGQFQKNAVILTFANFQICGKKLWDFRDMIADFCPLEVVGTVGPNSQKGSAFPKMLIFANRTLKSLNNFGHV